MADESEWRPDPDGHREFHQARAARIQASIDRLLDRFDDESDIDERIRIHELIGDHRRQLDLIRLTIGGELETPSEVWVVGSMAHLLNHLGWTRRYPGKLAALAEVGAIRLEEVPGSGKRPTWRMLVLKPELARGPGVF